MKIGESTEIRLAESNEKNIYTICFENIQKKGLIIKEVRNEPMLIGKVLHHWNNFVIYETLSIFEIKASIECADALNSFNDDILQREIDDIVNEAISLELPMYDENVFNSM